MSDQSGLQEAELMRRIVERDQTAFDALYAQYATMVQRMALRILNGDHQAADEVVQDVFFQIWRWPGKWNPDKGSFVSWLLTVARHTAIDQQRRRKRLIDMPIDTMDTLDMLPSHSSAQQTSDRRRLLKQLLKKLPTEQREVVMLAFLREMTHTEIADELGIPLGTVKSRLRLGMQKLRKAWLVLKKKQS